MTAIDDIKTVKDDVKDLKQKVEKLFGIIHTVQLDAAGNKTDLKYVKWMFGISLSVNVYVATKLGFPVINL